MRILIITPKIPFPPYRGDILHIFNIAKTLAERNHVDIITQYTFNNQIAYVHELKKNKLNTYIVKQTLLSSIINLMLAIFKKIPFQVAYFSSKKMSGLIKERTSKYEYDLIYFHLIRSVQYFDDTINSNAIKISDFTDAVSLYIERYLRFLKNPLRKLFFSIELKRLKEYEINARKFKTIFVCSDADKTYLDKKLQDVDIQILRNGVEEKYFYPEKIVYQKHRIIFSGNMPYYPNKDAAIYFARQIFPLVLNKYPDSKFYIVGQNPPQKTKKLNSENIIVTGFVEDIRREYLLSEVNVAPIRFGAGTLNKVIESLALGVPIIATKIVVDGLPTELRKYVFLADSPNEFAEKISYIFEHDEVRNDLMKECIELVPKLLGWHPIIQQFEKYIESKLNE